MYDPATGRGYDGLMGPSEFRVNRNAGAEFDDRSTDGAAGGSGDPIAPRYLAYKPQHANVNPWQVLEAETAAQIRATQLVPTGPARAPARPSGATAIMSLVSPGDVFSQTFSVPDRRALLPVRRRLAPVGGGKEFPAETLRAPGPARD